MSSNSKPSASFEFPKSERLTSREQIDCLFRDGKTLSGPHFRSIYTINEGEGPGLKVMLSAPKRIWPKAKDRNRQKRRLKEAFRLEANPLKAAVSTEGKTIHLALLASSKKPADFAELRLKMKLTLEAIANELSF